MMEGTAVIFCPGPSLARFHTEFLDLPRFVIGVNRAATRFPCDYWVALDWPLVEAEMGHVIGRPVLITKADNHDHLRKLPMDRAPGGWSAAENIREKVPDAIGYTNFSATTALALALTLRGVHRVLVYGADWAVNAPDFDGVMASCNRTADRFAWEASVWAKLCEWAAGRVTVERVALPAS